MIFLLKIQRKRDNDTAIPLFFAKKRFSVSSPFRFCLATDLGVLERGAVEGSVILKLVSTPFCACVMTQQLRSQAGWLVFSVYMRKVSPFEVGSRHWITGISAS